MKAKADGFREPAKDVAIPTLNKIGDCLRGCFGGCLFVVLAIIAVCWTLAWWYNLPTIRGLTEEKQLALPEKSEAIFAVHDLSGMSSTDYLIAVTKYSLQRIDIGSGKVTAEFMYPERLLFTKLSPDLTRIYAVWEKWERINSRRIPPLPEEPYTDIYEHTFVVLDAQTLTAEKQKTYTVPLLLFGFDAEARPIAVIGSRAVVFDGQLNEISSLDLPWFSGKRNGHDHILWNTDPEHGGVLFFTRGGETDYLWDTKANTIAPAELPRTFHGRSILWSYDVLSDQVAHPDTRHYWPKLEAYDSPEASFEIRWGRTQQMCCVPVPRITPLNWDYVNIRGEKTASIKWPDWKTGFSAMAPLADGSGIITAHRDGKIRFYKFRVTGGVGVPPASSTQPYDAPPVTRLP